MAIVATDGPRERRDVRKRRMVPVWISGYAGVILLMVTLTVLATQLARTAYGLTLPSMRDSLGLSYSQAGGLVTAASILGTVGFLVFGTLAPRYGSRFIVGAATVATGVAMVALGASNSFILVLAMSAAIGLASGGATTPAMGLLSVWFDQRNRGTVAGLAAAGGGLSFVVSGAVVPWLTGRNPEDGWRHSWYSFAVLVMVIGLLTLVFLRDRPREAGGPKAGQGTWPIAAYRSRLVWLVSFLAFCSGWVNGLYATFFGVYLEDQGLSAVFSGRLWALMGLLGIGSGVLWGSLSDRLGRRQGFFLSFSAFGLGCLLFWVAPVTGGFIASAVLVGLSFRAAFTICAASAGDYVDTRYSSAAFGLMGMGAGLGQATGPLIGGRIADYTGDLGWVYVLAAGGAAVAVASSLFLRRPRPGP